MIKYPTAVIGNEKYEYYAIRYGSQLKNIRFEEYDVIVSIVIDEGILESQALVQTLQLPHSLILQETNDDNFSPHLLSHNTCSSRGSYRHPTILNYPIFGDLAVLPALEKHCKVDLGTLLADLFHFCVHSGIPSL